MSIVQTDKIDAIGTDKKSGEIVLTITDHLDWANELYHIEILQEKINSYIQFIEGGQIYKDYPKSIGKKVIIVVVSKYECNEKGKEFLAFAKPIVESIGAKLVQITGNDPEVIGRVSELV